MKIMPFQKIIILCLILFNIYVNCNLHTHATSNSNSNSNTDEQNSSGMKEKLIIYLKTGRNYIFLLFESIEFYTVKLHIFFKEDLKVPYPWDLICFFFIGILLYNFFKLFNFKRNYVYNHPDQPDISALINNVSF
jgi:hypothetical protein